MSAVGLTAISYLDLELARQIASEMIRNRESENPLLKEVIDNLTGRDSTSKSELAVKTFNITVLNPNGSNQTLSVTKEQFSVGRAVDNDVVLIGPGILPHHAMVSRQGNTVHLRKSSVLSKLFVDDIEINDLSNTIKSGVQLSLFPLHNQGPRLLIQWLDINLDYTVEVHDTVTKLIWISSASIFSELDLGSLTEIAKSVEIRRYTKDTWLCKEGENSGEAFLLQTGSVDVIVSREGQNVTLATLKEGALIGELGVITDRPRSAAIRVSSTAARVLIIKGESLRRIMERNSSISMSLLKVVAGYVKT
jgi:hypothetical protein